MRDGRDVGPAFSQLTRRTRNQLGIDQGFVPLDIDHDRLVVPAAFMDDLRQTVGTARMIGTSQQHAQAAGLDSGMDVGMVGRD